MSVKFTDRQLAAIDNRGCTTLVLAGAGSGKTSVLTERIIRRVTDNVNPCDITDFLVVTFTKASAADLKKKIARAINDKLAVFPHDPHLGRQQILLARANISTIDAFCLDIATANFESLGIPARFRMGSENEIAILEKSVAEELIEEYYDPSSFVYRDADFSIAEFIAVAENFSDSKSDEGFIDLILDYHKKMSAFFSRESIIQREMEYIQGAADSLDADVFAESPFGRGLCANIRGDIDKVNDAIEICVSAIDQAANPKFTKYYSSALNPKREFISNLQSAIDGGTYADIHAVCSIKDESRLLGGKKPFGEELYELGFTVRDTISEIKERVNSRIRPIFAWGADDIRGFSRRYAEILRILEHIIQNFESALFDEKKKRRCFSFADVEQFAARILIKNVDGEHIEATDVARILRGRYREIYVDEYQDTNELQDMIFRVLSTEDDTYAQGNRFLVGDVKQSIYAFRGAKPAIISGYSRIFSELAAGAEPRKIYLRENFRSERGIIDALNFIFSPIFTEKIGGADYKNKESLVYGSEKPREAHIVDKKCVTFALIEEVSEELAPVETDDDIYSAYIDTGDNDVDDGDPEVEYCEAEYVALKVRDLLRNGKKIDGSPVRPSDIAILTQTGAAGEIFFKAMQKYDIPVYKEKSEGFLESAEILLYLSLLRAVDNPYDDISLTAVLKSPIFGFSVDDLIYLTNFLPSADNSGGRFIVESLYERIVSFTAEPVDDAPAEIIEKCVNFLNRYSSFTKKSSALRIDRFIYYLYRMTGMEEIITAAGRYNERRANLYLLHEYARTYERNNNDGLFGFLSYMEQIRDNKKDLERAKILSGGGDVIKILTVHKSKGLEFPICFAAGTAKKFNNESTRNTIIGNDGIYFKLKSSDGLYYEDPIFRLLAKKRVEADLQSERMRLMYVEFTRAKEQLFITGSAKKIYGEKGILNKKIASQRDFEDIVKSAGNQLDFLLPVILDEAGNSRCDAINAEIITCETLISNIRAAEAQHMSERQVQSPDDENLPANGVSNDEIDALKKYIRAVYEYRYPVSLLSRLPAKMAVSNLHPGIFEDDGFNLNKIRAEKPLAPLPRFLEDDDPALRGNSMHFFMQFCDFESAERYGAAHEAARLLKDGFISEVHYKNLDFKRLDNFFISDLYTDIKAAKEVFREIRFNLKVNAADFPHTIDRTRLSTANADALITDKSALEGEFILVQGVIDLFFITTQNYVVVADFKTDRVKPSDGEEILISRHKSQLEYYCAAVEEITARPVSSALIYSFHLNKSINVSK